MAWRVISIGNPTQLSTKNQQLVIKQDETVSVPIEDIDTLVIDNYGVTISTNLITELSSAGTTVIICDSKHMPASVLLPYSQHSRQAKVSAAQLSMGVPFKKQLWRKIVEQKIANQAEVLRRFDHRNDDIFTMSSRVKSGDSTNRESLAARLYFDRLLDDATRRKPLWHNAALNFGYALIRSSLARHIAARGLVASQGIFHRSALNSFNLADDLIEPFRPIIDYYVMREIAPFHIGDPDASLTKHDREALIDILNKYAIIKNKKFTLKHAAEVNVESFSQAVMENSTEALILPQLPPQ